MKLFYLLIVVCLFSVQGFSQRDQTSIFISELLEVYGDENPVFMPPVAREHSANEMSHKAYLIEGPESHYKVFKKLQKKLNDNYLSEYSYYEDKDEAFTDAIYTVKFRASRDFLISYLAPFTFEQRKVLSIFAHFDFLPQVSWYQIYNIGAEIVGEEVIVISFWDYKKKINRSIVIELSYVQA